MTTDALYHDGHEFGAHGGTCKLCRMTMVTWWQQSAQQRKICPGSRYSVGSTGHDFDVTGMCRKCKRSLHTFPATGHVPSCQGEAQPTSTERSARSTELRPSEDFSEIRKNIERIRLLDGGSPQAGTVDREAMLCYIPPETVAFDIEMATFAINAKYFNDLFEDLVRNGDPREDVVIGAQRGFVITSVSECGEYKAGTR